MALMIILIGISNHNGGYSSQKTIVATFRLYPSGTKIRSCEMIH